MLVRSFNPKKLETLAREIAATGTWICPTLNTGYNIAHLDDSALAKDKRMEYVDSSMRNFWNPAHDFRFKDQPPGYYELGRQEFEKKLIITTALHKAGIKFLAGTDTPNPYCFPGFSLHDELQWFVKAGLSPAEALQTATINPAIYFSIQKDYGTVEKGKIASLVLLNKNPLKDIRNTTDIYMVILRGRPVPDQQRKDLLNQVRILVGN
jgi:imidazolonepropionase-like amidohydrolase